MITVCYDGSTTKKEVGKQPTTGSEAITMYGKNLGTVVDSYELLNMDADVQHRSYWKALLFDNKDPWTDTDPTTIVYALPEYWPKDTHKVQKCERIHMREAKRLLLTCSDEITNIVLDLGYRDIWDAYHYMPMQEVVYWAGLVQQSKYPDLIASDETLITEYMDEYGMWQATETD